MPPVEIDPVRVILALLVWCGVGLACWLGLWVQRWRLQAWIEAESYRQLVSVLNEKLIVGGMKHITVRYANDALPESERRSAVLPRSSGSR